MFKTEYFKRHFLYLILTAVISWVVFFVYLFGISFLPVLSPVTDIILKAIAVLIFMTPLLCLTGYFWCLTDNIISRELEPKLNSVYNGKADFVNKITLPDWDIPRFVWRGIASIVATIIMYIPFVLLVWLFTFNMGIMTVFLNVSPEMAGIGLFVFILILSFFVPGLLWNYARRDSVVAVLNFPKAVYLVESYPGKYCLNTFLFIIFSIARSLFVRFLAIVLGIAPYLASARGGCKGLGGCPAISGCPTGDILLPLIVFAVISFIIGVYWLFVNAFLLGTVAPPSEG
jgi:hypothetical protein